MEYTIIIDGIEVLLSELPKRMLEANKCGKKIIEVTEGEYKTLDSLRG